MYKCYFFLPVLFSQARQRFSLLCRVLHDLSANIRFAHPKISNFQVHIYLNGSQPRHFDLPHYISALQRNTSLNLTITFSAIADKLIAVNRGLEEARNTASNLFFCVDNDILIPRFLLRSMIEIYERDKCEGIVCEKAPVISKGANKFQLLYSSFIDLALRSQIFPNRRPTGSFYCVDPYKLHAFPLNCNEGDFLARSKIIHTNGFVYSAYPASLTEEVIRRRRIAKASDSLDYIRDIQNIEFVNYMERFPPFQRSIQTDFFWESFYLYKQVIQLMSEGDDGNLIS